MPNDWSGSDAVAVWNMESGALTTDSVGTNTLTDNNTVQTDTVNYKQGSASADHEKNNSEYFDITDANLDSGFPLKNGGDGTFGLAFWYQPESSGAIRVIISKYDFHSTNDYKSLLIRDNNGTLEYYIGHTNGTAAELLDNSHTFTLGKWYHIGITFNNTTKAWQLRVYEDGGSATTYSGTATNNLSITSTAVPFMIGAAVNNGAATYYIDGNLDEVVVFDAPLTVTDIDAIRNGTYSAGGLCSVCHFNLLQGDII
jgi:hypothetical protein